MDSAKWRKYNRQQPIEIVYCHLSVSVAVQVSNSHQHFTCFSRHYFFLISSFILFYFQFVRIVRIVRILIVTTYSVLSTDVLYAVNFFHSLNVVVSNTNWSGDTAFTMRPDRAYHAALFIFISLFLYFFCLSRVVD